MNVSKFDLFEFFEDRLDLFHLKIDEACNV